MEKEKETNKINEETNKKNLTTNKKYKLLSHGTTVLILLIGILFVTILIMAKVIDFTVDTLDFFDEIVEENKATNNLSTPDFSKENEVHFTVEDKSFGQVGVPQWLVYYFTVSKDGVETYLRVPKELYTANKVGDTFTVYRDSSRPNYYITKEGLNLYELQDN